MEKNTKKKFQEEKETPQTARALKEKVSGKGEGILSGGLTNEAGVVSLNRIKNL